MRRIARWATLAALLVSGAVTGAESDAGHYADLAFGFCTAVAANPDSDVATVAAGLPGVSVRGPVPLADVGKWSEALQERLAADAATPVHIATTTATRVGAFHMAYALTDGSRCVALAQQIPGARAAVEQRIEADAEYQFMGGSGAVRLFARAVEGGAGSHVIVLPPDGAGITEVRVERRHVRARSGDDARLAWSRGVLDACVAAAQAGRVVTVADFGELMHESPRKDGKGANIVAPESYPASMLFPADRPAGCRLVLTAGASESGKVVALMRARLAELGARERGGVFVVPAAKRADPPRAAVRATFAELPGALGWSVLVLAD